MAEEVLQEAVTQTLSTYVARRQVKVVEWVATWPIFDVCTLKTGFKGGGRLWGAVVEAEGRGVPDEGQVFSNKVAAETGIWHA